MSLNRRENRGGNICHKKTKVWRKPARLSGLLRRTFEFRMKKDRNGIGDGLMDKDERSAGDVKIPGTLPYPITAVRTSVFLCEVAIGNFL